MITMVEFEWWVENSTPEERYDYSAVFGINTQLRQMIDDFMPWIFEEEFEDIIITLEYVVLAVEIFLDLGWLTEERAVVIKQELYRLNFGSMSITF